MNRMKDIRDIEKRRALAQQLRWLIGSRITNDQFDDFYYDVCMGCKDATVSEIADWTWTLYSGTSTYHLKGKHSVTEEVRTTAIRAIVFLRSGSDYAWPKVGEPFFVFLLRLIGDVAVPFTIAMAIIAFPLWWGNANWVGEEKLAPRLLGVIAAFVGINYGARALSKRIMRPIAERFEAAGDRECWPFLCESDLVNAMKQGRLLAKN
jgi:hypothetical protein